MSVRQWLLVAVLGTVGAGVGFGFIGLATWSEQDESRCRLCDQRGWTVPVDLVATWNGQKIVSWDLYEEGGSAWVADWPLQNGPITCYCKACQNGWHRDNPPKRPRR